jgi:hypothetical protein
MRPLTPQTINEIVHRHALGQPIRGIARALSHSRRAVRRPLVPKQA